MALFARNENTNIALSNWYLGNLHGRFEQPKSILMVLSLP